MKRPLIGVTTHPTSAGAGPEDQLPAQAAYVRAVAEAGGVPVFIPLTLMEYDLAALFDRLDGLLLTGGGDVDPALYGALPTTDLRSVDPGRDRTELALARWAATRGKPVLGICRGLQVLNVACGGTLIQDIGQELTGALDHDVPDRPPSALAHPVRLESGSLLARLLPHAPLETNSSHHQAIKALGRGLSVAAWARDGIIEAVEVSNHPWALAVQWHPERLLERDESRTLFTAFIQACA
jgi:putative glutamine amidotransferase